MSLNQNQKNDYMFREKEDGTLDFIGDFESFYLSDPDPWGQSATPDGEMSKYYRHSRDRLSSQLERINPPSLVEIGCGLGYTTEAIQNLLIDTKVIGIDVSNTAISKAQEAYPHLSFQQGDITSNSFFLSGKCEVVILNQLLWYILESLSETFENCFSILKPNGRIIISQAFLQAPQKYGKDICDGFDGLISYLGENMVDRFGIEHSNLDDSNSFVHNDGLIILKKHDS